jgi:AraC-like DNA-binding protein
LVTDGTTCDRRLTIDAMDHHGDETEGFDSFVDGTAFGFAGFAGFRMLLDGPHEAEELPHPQVTIVFQFGEPVLIGRSNRTCRARAVVVGLAQRPIPTSSNGLVHCIEVRLSPTAAFRLLGGVTMTELADGPADLAAVLGSRVDLAVERACEAADWSERFEIVSSLFDSPDTERRAAPEVEEAWSMIMASGGQINIRDVTAATGWSVNRLRARFEAQIGLTPKRAARLIRFERARLSLADGMSAIDTAISCGFADQSHLHHEIRSFAGTTPALLACAQQ